MNPMDILSRNHDIHMHSREFSDGSHPVLDVVRHTARWQDSPRWVGLSDHNPPGDEHIQDYIRELRNFQQEILSRDGITVLTGMELDWTPAGPASADPALAGLDYILAGYHSLKFSTASQVELYFERVALHEYTDVVAHPDRFLGSVDTLSVKWEGLFNTFKAREIMCEYNLTTPLRPEILAIATQRTDVNFIIGSDTHDFRRIAVRRIIDAWSESLGGGYELAREYLLSLLKMECSQEQIRILSRLFETNQKLDELQQKVYIGSRSLKGDNPSLSPEEGLLVNILEGIPECALDKDFLIRRLDRFATLPAERIHSLLKVDDFKEMIGNGRQLRKQYNPHTNE